MKQKLIDILGHIRHPYLFLAIAMFSCMLQFEISHFGNAKGAAIITALVIVQILAIACYWFPVQGALAILVFNGIGEYAIAGYGVFTSYMLFMALLILSYKLSNRGAIAVYAAVICYTILEGVLRPEFMSAQTVTSFCAAYTLIAIGAFLPVEQRTQPQVPPVVACAIRTAHPAPRPDARRAHPRHLVSETLRHLDDRPVPTHC